MKKNFKTRNRAVLAAALLAAALALAACDDSGTGEEYKTVTITIVPSDKWKQMSGLENVGAVWGVALSKNEQAAEGESVAGGGNMLGTYNAPLYINAGRTQYWHGAEDGDNNYYVYVLLKKDSQIAIPTDTDPSAGGKVPTFPTDAVLISKNKIDFSGKTTTIDGTNDFKKYTAPANSN